MSPARGLAYSVVACLAGAALALYGATRVWSLQITERPGLSDLRASTTGATKAPLLIGLALVALAGAGAILATRGLVRRLLGGLLTAVGLGLAANTITTRSSLDPGAAGAGATLWPTACVLGSALIVVGGLIAARHGHRFPTMSSRYERRPVQPPPSGPPAPSRPSAPAGLSARSSAAVGESGVVGRESLVSGSPAAIGDGGSAGRGPSVSGSPAAVGDSGVAGQGTSGPSAAAGPDGQTSSDAFAPSRAAGSSEGAGQVASGASAPFADRVEAPALDTRATWDALDHGDDPTDR
jgi:uncharacterized membrane protein (TIGR02234 family)